MSKQPRIDNAKVTQMLDAGWQLSVYKNEMGSYAVRAIHPDEDRVRAVMEWECQSIRTIFNYEAIADDICDDIMLEAEVITESHTPFAAMTVMAYKVLMQWFGEHTDSESDKEQA